MAPSSPPCISESTMPNAVTSLHGVQTHTGTATVLPHCLITNGLDNKDRLIAHSAYLHALIDVDVTVIAYQSSIAMCCAALHARILSWLIICTQSISTQVE